MGQSMAKLMFSNNYYRSNIPHVLVCTRYCVDLMTRDGDALFFRSGLDTVNYPRVQ